MHGSKGIELEVKYFKPNHQFVHGEFMNLFIEVMNKGVYDNPTGFIKIIGHDSNAISFKETKKDLPSLVGKKPYIPEGDSFILKFEETAPLNVPYGSSHQSNLLISACYNYQTNAIVTVCIPTLKEYAEGSPVCKTGAKSLSSQGAPVAVTYIEPSVGADELQYIIHVSNVGDGVIIKEDMLSNCPSEIGPSDIDEVRIDVQISALGTATCTNNNLIKLYDGNGATICRIKKGTGDVSYETQMGILLNYAYTSSIKESINIVDPFYTGKEKYE
ncbi:hypothetical protein HOC35_02165 [Candidatus Woesearchaeota archaeon]|nr:hypothetical protein [Candidatus Woesearchaeota archaeon]